MRIFGRRHKDPGMHAFSSSEWLRRDTLRARAETVDAASLDERLIHLGRVALPNTGIARTASAPEDVSQRPTGYRG